MMIKSIILLTLTTFVVNIEAQRNLSPALYEWKYLEFLFPTDADKNNAIRSGEYIAGTSFPLDIDVYYGASGILQFVTMPRFFKGTPITLGTISGYTGLGGPIIAPFPDYSWHKSGNGCNGFTNVFRVFVDECQRLWVLDSGVIDDVQTCPAKLVMFDLKSKATPPFTHIFSNTLNRSTSLFITPVVDVRNCNDKNTMVYIADVTGFGVIVFDYKNNRSWRTESQYDHLRAIDKNSYFSIAGEGFTLMDGVFGLALSPKTYTNRQLFFHSLAGTAENRIPLSYLDNPLNWPVTYPQVMNYNQFVQMGLRETTQTTVQAMDWNGNLFFGTIYPPGIGCWDSSTPYTNANLKLVARNDATLQFISGLKIVTVNGQQELWVMSNRFQKIIGSTRRTTEVNYRVHKVAINTLLNGSTRCNGVALPRA